MGAIDIDEYLHYDNPANGDLQEVVPGKIVALRTPVDLGGGEYRDRSDGVRDFSPAFHADILHGMGVCAVVRLGEPRYAGAAFESRGLAHHDVDYAGGACPPDAAVAAFFQIIAATSPRALAVVCETGRGRAGTLTALYLMRWHKFSAREAMGWLRIMRPGSVNGEQQRYLCAVEDARRALRARSGLPPVAVGSCTESPTEAPAPAAAQDERRSRAAGSRLAIAAQGAAAVMCRSLAGKAAPGLR